MAKSTKTVAKPAAKKVSKLTKPAGQKAAKAAKAKPAKASGQQATRSTYANRPIRHIAKPAREFRGGRAARWAMVAKAKNTDDVLGKSYTVDGEAEARTFVAANLHPFIDAGCIELG